MPKHPTKIRRAGAYIIKAAESRPTRVTPKTSEHTSIPTREDKRLAHALMQLRIHARRTPPPR